MLSWAAASEIQRGTSHVMAWDRLHATQRERTRCQMEKPTINEVCGSVVAKRPGPTAKLNE